MGETPWVCFLVIFFCFCCSFKFSRSDTDYFLLDHSLLIDKSNIMKCWIASILSHKALVNAETSHLQHICFMVAVTMESTGLLFRSCGLSW